MDLIITATYLILGGLIIILAVLLSVNRNREKENIDISDAILGPEELEKHAASIARDHVVDKNTRLPEWLIPRMNKNYRFILESYKRFNEEAKNAFDTAPAVEWLLDNFYVVEEQVKDIRLILEKDYYSQLPVLRSGYLRGYPRVYAIALELVAHTDSMVDEKTLVNFIKAYQSQVLLSSSELWAIATMVRIALIENMRFICEKVVDSQNQWQRAEELSKLIAENPERGRNELLKIIKEQIRQTGTINPSFMEHLLQKLRKLDSKSSSIILFIDEKLAEQNLSIDKIANMEHQIQASRQVSMGNCITSLRAVSTMNWTDIFESLSKTEEILRKDPAGIYPLMDFESRDYYRHQVEKLADAYNTSEMLVSQKAVEYASKAALEGESSSPEAHVGYYLIGKGRKKLKAGIGYRAARGKLFSDYLKEHSKLYYFGLIGILTLLPALLISYYAGYKTDIRFFSDVPGESSMWKALMAALTFLIVLIPIGDMAISTVNLITNHLFKPTVLPKLELKDGIPEELGTMVIIPALLPNQKRVEELLQNMEVHYLANKERNLYFALLGDFKDSDSKHMPGDDEIVEKALEGVRSLNKKYASEGRDIFYYFHRYRQFNEAQNKWMGWERKRGAIMEFNDLLRGNTRTSYNVMSCDISYIPYIKYIITLDADTSIPIGNAKKLIGTLAHPMNKPVYDVKKNRVVEGYGLLQPRIGIDIVSANKTLFSRIFAGQGGIDPYTTAVSDVYQDLFDEGIFTGKGIYDLDIFQSVLKNTIPENTVLSHDLLEGSYVRTGLVTDIELIDGYPAKYNSYAMRLHRWVRGDWQLLPWMFKRVRNRWGEKQPNPLSVISKWKIFDNLRRSVVSPSLLVLILAGLTVLPGSPAMWLGLALLTSFYHLVLYGVNNLLLENFNFAVYKRNRKAITGLWAVLYQCLLQFVFIPYQAYLMLDAIIRTLIRVTFSKRNMLEWVTAADMEAALKNDIKSFIRRMWISPLLGILVLLAGLFLLPDIMVYAVLLAVLWISAPFTAQIISRPYRDRADYSLSYEDMRELRKLARKTWRYFEDMATYRDNYLPPDNYQENPPRGIAHRTSPTNIGLLLASTLSARDMGYISTLDMAERLSNSVSTIERMEKWKGHLYNWYDTINLQVLRPRYVSTVDSGNFVAYLMTVEEGLKEYLNRPVIGMSEAEGLLDIVEIFNEEAADRDINIGTFKLSEYISQNKFDLYTWKSILDEIYMQLTDKETYKKICRLTWGNKLIITVSMFRDEIKRFFPLIDMYPETQACRTDGGEKHQEVFDLMDRIIRDLSAEYKSGLTIEELITKNSNVLTTLDKFIGEMQQSSDYLYGKADADRVADKKDGVPCAIGGTGTLKGDSGIGGSDKCGCNEAIEELKGIKNKLIEAQSNLKELKDRMQTLIAKLRKLADDTKFSDLFDPKRQLFAIGINVEEGKLSKSYYDLFASEARQASFIAIARGEIDKKHWFRLGRKLTMVDGYRGLVSWTGTMFEYLMPLLLMRNFENTLLDETYLFVLRNQKRYGEKRNIPWGVSESAYYAFDMNLNYQYKAFGVPELGLKRGLANDMVVAPYAAIMAVTLDPKGVAENIKRLKREGLDGAYGMYEAVDYTPSRLAAGKKSNIVKNFMAHHQGMSILALNNFFNDNIMQRRFHKNPAIRAAEFLLQEKVPTRTILTKEYKDEFIPANKIVQKDVDIIRSFGLPDTELPNVHLLSNGSYSVMLTDRGSGYSKNNDLAVSRWREELRGSSYGMFIFIEDIESGLEWSATYEPLKKVPDEYRVVFTADKAKYIRRDGDIETQTEVVVSPEDNVEIRRVSITNRGEKEATFEVTSYFEVVLAGFDADLAHPAFSNLFISTEYSQDFNCLLASRRPRSEKQQPVWAVHGVLAEGETIGDVQYETDRAKFIGRNRSLENPLAMELDRPLSNTVGSVIDPIMSLRRRIRVQAGHTVRLSFMVGVSDTKKNALELAEKYSEKKNIERTFDLAWTRSQIETRYLGFKPKEIELYLNMVSSVIFAGPVRRRWADKIVKNKKGQPDLWPFGISGDVPIVLVCIADKDDMSLVNRMLKAYEYWKLKGLSVDLVIMIEGEGGYLKPLHDMVRDAVASSYSRDFGGRGGIFVLNADTMSDEDKTLVYGVSRIILRGNGGRIQEQLKIPALDDVNSESNPELKKKAAGAAGTVYSLKPGYGSKTAHGLIASGNAGQTNYAVALHEKNTGFSLKDRGAKASTAKKFDCSELKFFNGIGGFSKDGKEYVINLHEDQHTPLPWSNVIANKTFGFLRTESGGGFCWAENSREFKLTPWSNDPVTDPAGEVIYVRDEENGNFWTITPMPVREKEEYVIRHGFGYSIFEHSSHGVEQKLVEFVALEAPLKVAEVVLKNTEPRSRVLTLTYYIRPVMGVTDKITYQYITTEYDGNSDTVIVRNPYNYNFPGRVLFITASENSRSFTCDRTEFFGINGSSAVPEAMEREKLLNRAGGGFDPCAAIQVEVSLEAGEEKKVVFLLGESVSKEEALKLTEKFKNVQKAEREFERVRNYWIMKLGSVKVSTPDPSMDILLNGWLLYQVVSCRLWARSAFYQSGGAYGFRDQLQDVMAVTGIWPELARNQILLHAAHQFIEGDVQHWWHPGGATGADKGIRTKYSDDLLWLPYVTSYYIYTTNDWSILNEEVAYLEDEPLGDEHDERYSVPRVSQYRSSVYEHCIRAIERAARFGEHGIPLMGSGDWNDGMNTVGNKGRGESVWLGWFLYTTLKNFIPICKALKDGERAERYEAMAQEIVNNIEENAWDGSWYRRAYFDNGIPLGSAQNSECRIDSLAQSWSAISGAGNRDRVNEAMSAVEKYLVDREEGIIKLLTPPFNEGDLQPGYIKGYIPGVRENGGQYTHASAWVIMAFACMGQGNKAWELFNLINPINHSRTAIESARYKVEPYVMAADVHAVQPNIGRGGWTWYTGAAGWMYRVGMEYILGVRKMGNSLIFEPCIPVEWDEFRVKYRYNETMYDIHVTNPDRVSKGVKQVILDGKVQESFSVPLKDDGIKHTVEVIIG